MSRSILQRVGVALLAFFGWSFFQEYRAMHPYYAEMISSSSNRNIVLVGLLFSLLPSAYIVFTKKRSFWTVVSLFLVSLILFGFAYLLIRDGILGGHIKFILNVVWLLALAVFMMVSFTVGGEIIQTKILKTSSDSIFGVILSMGLGLVAFIIINHILVLLNLFYPVVTWGMFFGAIAMLWFHTKTAEKMWHIIDTSIAVKQGIGAWIVLFLLMVSFVYLYNGFMLALIPYSTAWDANHAYMFFPKMRAYNHGYFWDNIDMNVQPQLWYSFIAYWFSLFQPFGSFFGLAPDSYGIMMNFWSGLFVLIFGVGLVTEVVGFIASKQEEESPWYTVCICMGWFLLLQWLTSGMGAFLVFIDNKTDLGVLCLVILALYSGFVFLRSVQENKNINTTLIAVSGFLFAIAGLAKPTALFDVVNFAAFLWATWFGALGSLGIVLVVLGVIAGLKIMGIGDYISSKQGAGAAGLGIVAFLFGSLRGIMQSMGSLMKYIMIWALSFIATLLVFKIPYFIVAHAKFNTDISPVPLMKGILFGATEQKSGLGASDTFNLYAQNGMPQAVQACTLASKGLQFPQDLYKNLKTPPGNAFNEDVGRYVGFGWKGAPNDQARGITPFKNSWWASFLKPGCHAFNLFNWLDTDAKVLCETELDRKSLDTDKLSLVQSSLSKDSDAASKVALLIATRKKGTSVEQTKVDEVETMRRLDAYMQGGTIKIVENAGVKEIYVPYKFLNFFNITFNRSLQNLSSYYTDIGIVWLLLIFFSVFGLLYGLVEKKPTLVAINVVTLFGRCMWLMIGGGILWYGIGIIIWSILSFIMLLWYFFDTKAGFDSEKNIATIAFLIVFCCLALLQLSLNLVRIASQGGSGPFLWYKSNFGTTQVVSDQGQLVSKGKSSYGYNDILDLQFPHYKAPIERMNKRAEGKGVVIAGTYLRYFMSNQDNTKADGFLTEFWKNASDNDPCLTYLRMKDQKLQYYVIDQNIGTVVQGDANKALFDRFFAKLNADGKTIDEHGAMTMLATMARQGYMNLISTNNVGTKYALSLPDASFQGMTGDEITLMRARMMIPRFFGQNAILPIVQIATSRVKDGSFVTDIADILGKSIREQTLLGIVQKPQLSQTDLLTLTEDEKYVLLQYLGLKQQQAQNEQQFQQTLQNLVMQSISGGSQLMVLEVTQ